MTRTCHSFYPLARNPVHVYGFQPERKFYMPIKTNESELRVEGTN